jgi:hypothetical protein
MPSDGTLRVFRVPSGGGIQVFDAGTNTWKQLVGNTPVEDSLLHASENAHLRHKIAMLEHHARLLTEILKRNGWDVPPLPTFEDGR